MRCAITLVAVVAVTLAAPLDKPADPATTSIPVASSTAIADQPLPEESKPVVDLSVSEAREPQIEDKKIEPIELPHERPQVLDNNLNKPLISEPHPPAHALQKIEEHSLEKPLEGDNPQVLDNYSKPEFPRPPVTDPHHIQEHGIPEHPDNPHEDNDDEELDSEEIGFLQALGALAISYDLELLQELEKELEQNQHAHHHSQHGHHHSHGHGHNSHNKHADLPCDCDKNVGAAIVVIPEHGLHEKH